MKYEDHSKNFINDLENKVLKKKMRLILIAVKDRSMAFCFVKSGNMRRSIGYKQIDNVSGIVAIGVAYGLKIELEYHPCLRPALRNSKALLQRIMGQ